MTIHRRENWGRPLEDVCRALKQLAGEFGEGVRFIYPVHPNPNVRDTVYRLLADVPGIALVPPLDYLTFVQLLKGAYLV